MLSALFFFALAFSSPAMSEDFPPPPRFAHEPKELSLSAAEREWISNHPDIRLGVHMSELPYESFTRDRQYEGIVSDFVKYINRQTGLRMRPDKRLQWYEVLKMIREREVDVVPMLDRTPEREDFVNFSIPYLKLKLAVVALEESGIEAIDDIRGKTIAVVMNHPQERLLKQDFPSSKFYIVQTVEDALLAVAKRKADAYVGDLTAITYLRRKLRLDNIKIVGITHYEIEFCFGVRKDWPELASIIDKALKSMPPRYQHSIQRYWTFVRVERMPDWSLVWKIGGAIGGASLLMLVVFVLWGRRLGREIIERKKAETLMRNSIQLLETLFDTIPGPVYYVGINGDFLGCNRAFREEIVGMDRKEMTGKSFYEIMRALNADKVSFFQHKTSALIQNPGVQIYDVDIVCTDNNVRDFTVYSATFKQNSREAGIVSVMLDITEKKKIEKELLLAINAAEAATDAKSNFVANMSHELRTPLNAVIGITHLIMQTELSEKQQNYLEKIDSASRHLLGVINDILDFSKIEAGKMTMESISFNFTKTCQEINDMFLAKAKEKNLKLLFSISPKIPRRLKGDPLRLKQILINLVSNAIKFTNSGEVSIIAELARKRGNKVKLKITVQDTGIGMNQEQLGSLFIPFTQADNSMTRKFGGTGLGLVITKSLIEIMNGHLEVESTPNAGSVFAFDIEVESESDEQETDTSTIIPVNRAAIKTRNLEKLERIRGASVLLVEDNAINRQVAMEMLSQAGIVVSSVENGKEAVELIVGKGKSFDAVFMDVQMPVMDGYKATELIRESGNRTPVIALTAHVMPAAIKRCLQAGMNDHLNKPLNPELMYSTLLKWIKPGVREHVPVPEETIEEEDAPQLCDMPGLNITRALEPIDGDSALLSQLLDTFRKDFGHEGSNILKAFETGDLTYMKHSFHKLKGSASYIGADELKNCCSELEMKLINGQEVKREEIDILTRHISQVVDSIAILIGKPTVAH